MAVSVVSKKTFYGSHFITGVCVSPAFQRRGLGTALLAASLGILRRRGLRRARVVTRRRTKAARFLYGKFGARVEKAAR